MTYGGLVCPRQSWRPLAQQAINWQMPDPEVISDTVNYEHIKVGLLESMAVPRKFLFKHFGKNALFVVIHVA